MKFNKIIVISLKDYNKNKIEDGLAPQDGTVINVFNDVNKAGYRVAIGFN